MLQIVVISLSKYVAYLKSFISYEYFSCRINHRQPNVLNDIFEIVHYHTLRQLLPQHQAFLKNLHLDIPLFTKSFHNGLSPMTFSFSRYRKCVFSSLIQLHLYVSFHQCDKQDFTKQFENIDNRISSVS